MRRSSVAPTRGAPAPACGSATVVACEIGHREATAADRQIIASLVHSAIAEVDRLTPFVSLVLGMTTAELANLNLKTFLMREDLLPPLPDGEEQSDESNPL